MTIDGGKLEAPVCARGTNILFHTGTDRLWEVNGGFNARRTSSGATPGNP